MTISLLIALCVSIASLVFIVAFTIFCYAKNNNTYKNHFIIIDAIYKYCKHENLNVNIQKDLYDSMKSYDDTFKCFFDWGYKNILPPEKFKLIEPYITKENKGEKK